MTCYICTKLRPLMLTKVRPKGISCYVNQCCSNVAYLHSMNMTSMHFALCRVRFGTKHNSTCTDVCTHEACWVQAGTCMYGSALAAWRLSVCAHLACCCCSSCVCSSSCLPYICKIFPIPVRHKVSTNRCIWYRPMHTCQVHGPLKGIKAQPSLWTKWICKVML